MGNLVQFNPGDFGQLMEFAKLASGTQMVPQSYQGKPQDIVCAVMMGADLGLSPMQSLQSIAVIRGKPTLWGDGQLAVVMGHHAFAGIKEWVEYENTEDAVAYCLIKRTVNGHVQETQRSYSVLDAKRAKLWNPSRGGPWKDYPMRMLQHRARGFACRDSFPDALRGILSEAEARDIPQKGAPVAQTVEAVATPAVEIVSLAELEPAKKVAKPDYAKLKGPRSKPIPERFDDACKKFDERGVSSEQLLAFCKVGGADELTDKNIKALGRAFTKVKKGEFPKGLEPATVACDSDIPAPPGGEMAGVEE